MLQLVSVLISSIMLISGLALLVLLLVNERQGILRALRMEPALAALPAPLPPRVRMVSPRRLALSHAAVLREAA